MEASVQGGFILSFFQTGGGRVTTRTPYRAFDCDGDAHSRSRARVPNVARDGAVQERVRAEKRDTQTRLRDPPIARDGGNRTNHPIAAAISTVAVATATVANITQRHRRRPPLSSSITSALGGIGGGECVDGDGGGFVDGGGGGFVDGVGFVDGGGVE